MPDEKVSVQDVMAFQRSTFEGTIYDMTADHDWLIPDGEGGFVKSPLTTPFPTPDMRHLLDIDFRRNVAKGGYGMVAQLRGWLPDPVGGIYWYFVDNQLYLKWQAAIEDVRAVRDSVEARYFDEIAAIDEKAAALYKKSPKKTSKYLTGLTWDRMEEMHGIYSELHDQLITKYTNNHVRP